MPTFDPSQPYEVISEPRVTRGSTFGDQNGPGTDSGDNGQFAYGGSSVNDQEDYAALPAGSNVPPGYQFPVLNPATGDVTWVTHRDKGPAKWTGRGVDLAPSAMEKLHAQTDDPLVVDTAKAVPPFDSSKPYQIVDTTPKQPQGPAIPSPTLAQEVGPSPAFIAPPKPEGSVFTDPQARADLVANVKQGLKDFIPTLKQGVATTVPHNREELVSALQDVTQKAAAPYEESMYRTAGPQQYDKPTLDLADPYAMVPGIPPGLIPELAKIKGPIGDYIRSQVEASPKHEPSGYERFGQAALGAASQLTTPHSAADIYSFKTPGAQQAFAAERLLSTPEQAAKVKQTYDEQGLPEAAATGLNEAIMDILPALHDAGKLKDAARYADLLPTPEAKPSIEQEPGQVYFQPGDAEATAQRTQGAGQQISPEHLQAIAQALGRRDTGLPNLEGEAGSPNRILENAIEKALRRTTLSPLRSATDIANANKTPVPQLDEKSNDASITADVQRPTEAPLKPEKEPAQGAETDLAPAGMENAGTMERQNVAPVGNAAGMERPGQPEAGAEAGQNPSAETLAGQINTETGRADRGLDPREEVLRREFGKSVELAQKKEANNPGAGRRLADRLEKSPKAVNDPDHVLLAQQVIQAQDEYDKAAKEVAANPDDKEAQHAADIADERIQKAYQAYDNAGTGTARGLAIRNVLKAHDYTLPAMQARFRTKVGDLTAAQAREIKGIHERITAADKVLGPEAAYSGLDKEDVKDTLKSLSKRAPSPDSDTLSLSPRPQAEPSTNKGESKITAAAIRYGNGDIFTGVTHGDAQEKAITAGHSQYPDGKTRMGYVTGNGEFLLPHEAKAKEGSAYSEGLPYRLNGPETKLYAGLDPEDIAKRLGRDVKRISKDTADYQARTEAKNIEPRKPKAEPLMSPEKQKALEDREQAKAEYHQMIARELYKQLPASKRLINKLVQLERSIKLTGVTTFAKLGTAGATRVAQTAAEELVGHAYSLVPGVRGTMMSAPTERPALPSDVGAYVKGFGKGIMQTGKVLKGKVDTMDVAESTKAFQPPSILDIPGRTHGAIKNPFKQAQASMAASKAEKAFARTGEAFNSKAIDDLAKQSGLRAILTNDNMVSTAYNRAIQYLESKGDAGFLGAKAMQFFLPIVRVPTNIALEAGQMIGGVPMGGGKLLMSAMRGGIKEMTPLERDFVARSFKKGTVGLALFSIGFFNSKNFGGFYQEKRKQGDVRWNEAKLGGVRIPWYLMHSAAALTMNAGATVRKLMDKEHESATVASLSTSRSLLHEIPFAEFIENIDKLLSGGYEGTNARGRLLQGSIVPQGVKNMAEFLDAAEKRYPRTELEYVKQAIPGLREEVPSTKPKKGH